MFCEKCGTEMESGAKYCPRCGALQNGEQEIKSNRVLYESRGGGKRAIRYGIGAVISWMIGSFVFVLRDDYYFTHTQAISPYEVKRMLLVLGIIVWSEGIFLMQIIRCMRKATLMLFGDHIEGNGFGCTSVQNQYWISLRDIDSVNLTKNFIVVNAQNRKHRLLAEKSKEAYEAIIAAKQSLLQEN